jgi:hypothetical protein
MCEAHPSKWEVQYPTWWNDKNDELGFDKEEIKVSLGTWTCKSCNKVNKVSNLEGKCMHKPCIGKVGELYKYTITIDKNGLDEEYTVYLRHNPNETSVNEADRRNLT